MTRERLQPSAETPRRIIDERRHQTVEFEEDHLCHVLGVGFLQSPAATPLQEVGTVARDKIIPGCLISGIMAKLSQQGGRRTRKMVSSHGVGLLQAVSLRPASCECKLLSHEHTPDLNKIIPLRFLREGSTN